MPSTENRRARNTLLAARLLVGALAISVAGCGYHVAGHSENLPSGWQAIDVPAFKNDTTRYRIEQKFTAAVIHELLSRTKYHMVQDSQSADGVLNGEILSIDTNPALFNATTGEVTAILVSVHVKVSLMDNKSGKVVYHNDDMVFRQEYQIETDVNVFFEEQDPALERMSRDLASHIVSNVLEGF